MTDLPTVETVTATEFTDIIACVCGNQTHTDGFYPCDPATGLEIDFDESWDGKSYVCSCGRVIDQTTLAPNPDRDRDFDATHVLTVTHHAVTTA